MKKYGREIAFLATLAGTGIALSSENPAEKPAGDVVAPENSTSENNTNRPVETTKSTDVLQRETETAESEKLFESHEFLLQELFELHADPEKTKEHFTEITGEFRKNRFLGSKKLEEKFYQKEVNSKKFDRNQKKLHDAAIKHGVPPDLLMSLCYVETGCQPKYNKGSGAAGYMQFLPDTAKRFGLHVDLYNRKKDERYNLAKSAEAAAKYLAKLHKKFGQWGLAMAAYSGGQGKLEGRLRSKFPEAFKDKEIIKETKKARDRAIYLKGQIKKKKGKGKNSKDDRRELLSLRRRLFKLIPLVKKHQREMAQNLKDHNISLMSLIDDGEAVNRTDAYAVDVQYMAVMFNLTLQQKNKNDGVSVELLKKQ